jgi:AraC-like DNA-binding protein
VKTQLWLPSLPRLRLIEVELVDVRRDNHDLKEWRRGYGPARKESHYFTLIAKASSHIDGPGWSHTLHTGGGLFVLPGEEIRASFSDGPVLRSYNLHFHLHGLSADEAMEVFPRVVCAADDTARLRDSLDFLIDATLRHERMLAECELCAFLLELARIPLRRALRNVTPLVREALDLIQRTQSPNLTREMIAEAVGVTPNHLSAAVKAETGRSITRHLQEARVRLSKDWMYSRRLNVSETAAALEMDIHSFSRLFKSLTGKSPGQYRKETMAGPSEMTPLDSKSSGR